MEKQKFIAIIHMNHLHLEIINFLIIKQANFLHHVQVDSI